MKLVNDITAADELAVDIDLWDRRPIRISLDAVPYRRIGEDILRRKRNAIGPEDLDRMGRKTTLREIGSPLHIQHDLIVLHLFLDFIDDVICHELLLFLPNQEPSFSHCDGLKVFNASA